MPDIAPRPLRVALLGLYHEANTFAAPMLDAADLARLGPVMGDGIIDRFEDGSATMSGFLDIAAPNIQLVPLRMLTCIPAPPIDTTAFHAEADALCDALASAGPFDVVLAALHGSCVAEGVLDADGYLLQRFRETVGPGTVIASALDLHANVSDLMLESADLINAYQTNPHVDARARARTLAEIAIAAARGEVRPTMASTAIRAVPNILQQNTDQEPMLSIVSAAAQVQRDEGVLSAVITEGYPYADVPDMGMRAIVITDDDRCAAQAHADGLADFVWQHRDQLEATAPTPDEAMASLTTRSVDGPTLALDVGDNIGAGSAGDSVVLLHAAIRHKINNLAMIITDHRAVAACQGYPDGAVVELTFGGWSHPDVGPPITAAVTVITHHHGRFTATGPVHAGLALHDAGPSVLIGLPTGQRVLLTSIAVMPVTPVQLQVTGLALENVDVIIAKGVHSPLAGYAPIVGRHVLVDTPGVTAANLRRLVYRNRPVPMLPFERQTPAPTHQEAALDQ